MLPLQKLNSLLTLLVLSICLLGCESPATNTTDTAEKTSGTVDLKVDFNGRKENQEFRIPCSKGSTVFQMLNRAMNIGDLEFESHGSGETAFVVSIDGIENEKADGDNWTYKVNGELGDRSCGAFEVKPGDQILWRFGAYP